MSGSLPERLRVVEHPIPEALTSVEFVHNVRRFHTDGLPGFLVRFSGLVDVAIRSHDGIVKALSDVLPLLDPEDDLRPYEKLGGLTEFSYLQLGEGQMHHDHRANDIEHYRVHRTKQGGGKVVIANSGHLGREIFDSATRHRWFSGAGQILTYGIGDSVDPDIIDPNVYTADLRVGDTLVFPTYIYSSSTHNKSGPVWHRFDNDEVPRKAELTVVAQM